MRRVLAGMLALAMLTAGCGDDNASGTSPAAGGTVEQTRPVTVTGGPLPTYPESGADPAVGMTMPELEGASFDGTPISITNDGRPKVLLFYAHWCPHCQDEVADFSESFAADGLPGDVDLYSISTSPDANYDNYPPSEWFAREDWPLSVLADSVTGEAGQAFGLTAFPYSVFVYADGTIAARAAGTLPYAAFLDAIDYLASNANG